MLACLCVVLVTCINYRKQSRVHITNSSVPTTSEVTDQQNSSQSRAHITNDTIPETNQATNQWNSSSKIQIHKQVAGVAIIKVITMIVLLICITLDIALTQKLNLAVSWYCERSNSSFLPIVVTVLYVLMGMTIFLSTLQSFVQCISKRSARQSSDRNTTPSTQQEVNLQNSDSKHEFRKKIILIAIMSPLFIIPLALAFTLVEAIMPVLIAYLPSTDDAFTDVLTPGDTRAFTFNSFFVSSLSVELVGSSHLSATLYVGNEQPYLNQSTIYNTTDRILCDQDECTSIWQSYLHQKSSMGVKVCLNESNGVNASFVVIKGIDNAKNWMPGRAQLNHSSLTESKQCIEQLLHIDHVTEADRYFFILYGHKYSLFDITFHINRTDYSSNYSNKSRVDSCTVNSHTTNKCTAHLQKVVGSTTALIIVTSDLHQPAAMIEWEDTISITRTYNLHAGNWTALWLPVLFVNVIVLSVLYALLIKYSLKKAQRNSGSRSALLANTISNESERVADQDPDERTPLLDKEDSSPSTSDSDSTENANIEPRSATINSASIDLETVRSHVMPSTTGAPANVDVEQTSMTEELEPVTLQKPNQLQETRLSVVNMDAEQRDVIKESELITLQVIVSDGSNPISTQHGNESSTEDV